MGDCVKSLTQVQIDNIGSFSLVCWCSHSITEGRSWSGKTWPCWSHAGCLKSAPCPPCAL